MEEVRSPVMPSGFTPAVGTYQGTWVWRYRDVAGHAATTYLGPIVLATRNVPTQIRFRNDLPADTSLSNLAFWAASVDQTLHWADPLGTGHSMTSYSGPIPAVPHLHGGEVPPQLDGGPDAWFTSDGLHRGAFYYTFANATPPTAANECVYRYPNTQEAAPIWFHDHALGATRLNVYAGLAGGYLVADPNLVLPAGLTPFGIGTETIVPLVIQDRMFDTNGQLYFPNVGDNAMLHPYWLPEFVGDAIVVNGKTWPTFGTAAQPKESKRYRFLFLNGSNARAYEMFLVDPVTKVMGPPMWVIGNDGGYLDRPVRIDPNAAANSKLVMLPGERYDVIVDFNDAAWRAANPAFSGTLILRNTAGMPYPKGTPPQGATVGQLLKLFIGRPAATDPGYDPASGTPLRAPMVRLADPVTGRAAVPPALRRVLTLNEVMGMAGPAEVLVNNTRWHGHSVATDVFPPNGMRPDFVADPTGQTMNAYSELLGEGVVEQWDIVNMTVDAHPIHLHLAQFQVLNRQGYNQRRYTRIYDSLFPGTSAIDPMTGLPHPPGVFIGGYGPPLAYDANAFALGGNPDVTPYLQGPIAPPRPQEIGWKDTVMALPGQVTRILVRWAPTDLPTSTPAANAYFPFDPFGTGALARGYVWHCHIIDHEDNEMMRPDAVVPNPNAVRTLRLGVDY
ncbi:MAG: multicopper oxidase domain-containing protein [Planctomycetes bacterium]|nr:multicopper oxidase domain-containing protein [Planctomycetota bacterium]